MIPKFRAWLKREKKMVSVVGISFYQDSFDVEEIFVYDQENPHKYGDLWEEPFLPYEFVLMQSTGLKDINDKEIYEGDVIIPDGGGASLVHWRDGAFQVGYYGDIPYVLADYKSLTVIGNIYENPELVSEFEEEANNERPRD